MSETLPHHGAELTRRGLATDAHAGTHDENLQQHVNDGGNDRHPLARHRLRDGWNRLAPSTQQPPRECGDNACRRKACHDAPSRHTGRPWMLRILHVAEEHALHRFQRKIQHAGAHAYESSHHQHECAEPTRFKRRALVRLRPAAHLLAACLPATCLFAACRLSISGVFSALFFFHPGLLRRLHGMGIQHSATRLFHRAMSIVSCPLCAMHGKRKTGRTRFPTPMRGAHESARFMIQ